MLDSTTTSLEKPSEGQFENTKVIQDEKITDREAGTLASPDATRIDEAAVLRKMDLRLIPMLSVLYLLAFLDRGNIGNAKIEGMLEDLDMTGPQFNWTCMSLLLLRSFIGKALIEMDAMNSDRVLLYLLRLRTPQQSSPQEAQTVQMAAIDHGGVGDCDGIDHLNHFPFFEPR